MKSRRSLRAILFTDIVGSTDRAIELGDRAWQELLEKHHAVVRREIRRFGGREINTTGDGFVIAFARPARAIRCASAIRESLQEIDIDVRAGIHMGAVEGRGREIGGVGVHIGSRIADEAGSGEILVSTAVRESETGSGFEFEDRGERELKGIPGRWRLHAVTAVPTGHGIPLVARWMPGWVSPGTVGIATGIAAVVLAVFLVRPHLGGLGGDAASPVTASLAAPAIAVLPFEVPDGEQEMWREGMVDALSTNLDGVAGLRVVDSYTLLGRWHEATPAEGAPDRETALGVARRAGARYAVTGSLIDTGHGLRLAAEVYDLEGERLLGHARVDGAADSILGLIDQLSVEILRTVGAETGDPGTVGLDRITTQSLPALRAYLRGEAHLRASRFEPAAEAYREAVDADSTFALAWLGLAEAYIWTAPSRVGEAVGPALRLADELPERQALLVRSFAEMRLGTERGLELLGELTRRYPDDLRAWFRFGEYLYHAGPALLVDPWETREAFQRATELASADTPIYAHHYFHRIDLEMRLAPDSATVHRLNDRVVRLVGASDPAFEALLTIAFGTDSSRAIVLRAIDTLTTDGWFPWTIYSNLSHPQFYPDKARVLESLRERSLPSPEDEIAAWMYPTTLFDLGRLEEALEAVDHPKANVRNRDWGGRLYLARVSGLPVPDERLDVALRIDRDIDPEQLTTPGGHASREAEILLSRGAWALERGRRGDFATVLARVAEVAERAEAEHDSVAARYAEGVMLGLQGYQAWKNGDLASARKRLDDARLLTNGSGGTDPVKKILRWWLARVELESGREERAAILLLSLGQGDEGPGDPLAMLALARVQEKLGRQQDARANYELFAIAWREADPALQALVRDALRAAARLEGS